MVVVVRLIGGCGQLVLLVLETGYGRGRGHRSGTVTWRVVVRRVPVMWMVVSRRMIWAERAGRRRLVLMVLMVVMVVTCRRDSHGGRRQLVAHGEGGRVLRMMMRVMMVVRMMRVVVQGALGGHDLVIGVGRLETVCESLVWMWMRMRMVM